MLLDMQFRCSPEHSSSFRRLRTTTNWAMGLVRLIAPLNDCLWWLGTKFEIASWDLHVDLVQTAKTCIVGAFLLTTSMATCHFGSKSKDHEILLDY